MQREQGAEDEEVKPNKRKTPNNKFDMLEWRRVKRVRLVTKYTKIKEPPGGICKINKDERICSRDG